MPIPELEAIYDVLWRANAEFSKATSVRQMREIADALYTQHLAIPDDVTRTQVSEPPVRGLWTRTPEAAENHILLYFHGGGYAVGTPETWTLLSGELGRAAGMRVLSVDYRLAPEHSFPAAVDDGDAAYRWLLDQGIPASSIIVSGDSAGAALALATMVRARDARLPLPAAQFLICPWVDMEMRGESMDAKRQEDPLVNREWLEAFTAMYLQGHDANDPMASPVHASLRGLPPMLVHVGSNEVLLDSVITLCRRAALDEVETRLVVWPGCFHVFHLWHSKLEVARRAIAEFGAFARATLESCPLP